MGGWTFVGRRERREEKLVLLLLLVFTEKEREEESGSADGLWSFWLVLKMSPLTTGGLVDPSTCCQSDEPL